MHSSVWAKTFVVLAWSTSVTSSERFDENCSAELRIFLLFFIIIPIIHFSSSETFTTIINGKVQARQAARASNLKKPEVKATINQLVHRPKSKRHLPRSLPSHQSPPPALWKSRSLSHVSHALSTPVDVCSLPPEGSDSARAASSKASIRQARKLKLALLTPPPPPSSTRTFQPKPFSKSSGRHGDLLGRCC